MGTSLKMQAKKERLSRLFTSAHQLRKSEGLTISKALRKSWVLFTTLDGNYRFSPSMFDFTSIDILCRSEYIGTVSILDGGFVNAKNKLHSARIFLTRHEAIKFAISAQKNKAITQLPLL